MNEIRFIDNDFGMAVGDSGIIIKTSNGGDTWTTLNSGTADTLESIFLVDQNHAWVVGQNGRVLHTENGGIEWDSVDCGTNHWLMDVCFIDDVTGWITGNNGHILYTDNGGQTWTEQAITAINLYGIYFSNDKTGWVVGDGGTILHTESGGMVGLQPVNFYLQNKFDSKPIPNPFSSQISIEYKLKRNEKVTLSIFNHLGQMVYYKEENQYQGTQQLKWNAEVLPDGIYYYRLHVGNSVTNGKILKVN